MDISKAFEKVWYNGLLYKLESLVISGNFLNIHRSFLNDRYRRVVLNSQLLDWAPILAGVPLGSILRQLLFLIYIKDLPNNLNSLIKLFTDDTSLLSAVYDPNHSSKVLNDDLNKIPECAYKWKMLFHPDLTKPAPEAIFSRKNIKTEHPIVCFNEALVAHTTCQKPLGVHVDEKLNFNHHINEKIAKVNKSIGLIRKLAYVLPRQSLIAIYKYYGVVIYDQPNNENFCNLIERIQYNAALAITGAIKGTSHHKIYKELGLESLKFRRWFK